MDPTRKTLRGAYSELLSSGMHSEADPKTVKRYRESLAHWARLTGDPPIAAVDGFLLLKFRTGLVKTPARDDGPPLSKQTANVHIRQINHVLAVLGPRAPGYRKAMGILPDFFGIEPYKTQKPLPRNVSAAAICAAYNAAGRMTQPLIDGLSVCNWWQALICLALNTGCRREALLGIEWSEVDFGQRTIRVLSHLDKRDTEREKPLNRSAVEHLMRIRRARGRVLPWRLQEAAYYRHWRKLQEAAGLDEAERFTLHDLKRTCGTMLSAHCGASPYQVDFMLDHVPGDVTGGHYVNPIDGLREIVERMPQPWEIRIRAAAGG